MKKSKAQEKIESRITEIETRQQQIKQEFEINQIRLTELYNLIKVDEDVPPSKQ